MNEARSIRTRFGIVQYRQDLRPNQHVVLFHVSSKRKILLREEVKHHFNKQYRYMDAYVETAFDVKYIYTIR